MVYNYGKDTDRKKYTLSNAFHISPPIREESSILPLLDHDGKMYNICDNFNSALDGKGFPHRHGGGGLYWGAGRIHKFTMASIVQNLGNLTIFLWPEKFSPFNFLDFLLNLSDEIYMEASTHT